MYIKMKRIVIVPYGRTGNNILQHMLALYLRSKIPEINLYCNSKTFLKDFGITFETEPESSRKDTNCTIIKIHKNGYNLESLIDTIRASINIHKLIIAYCLFDHKRYQQAGMLDTYRSTYGKADVSGFDERYLVIHIRLEDIANDGHTHQNYPVIPFSFHRMLLPNDWITTGFCLVN